MNNKKINTGELDFDAIKTNLKTFLQGQSQFSDYDFEGSGLTILLDVLAYNTHYNNLYRNLAINEAFLDSASKRNNVVSLAKSLGYIPRSVTAPTAKVNLRVYNTSSTPGVLTLPKYTSFSTTIDGDQYNFYTIEDVTTTLSGGEYLFQNLEIKEGVPILFNYTVANGVVYTIPNINCDLSTLKVRVKDTSLSVNSTPYVLATSILNVDSDSKIYFIKEIEDQLYELEFGDGTLGKSLEVGNVVGLEYLVTNAGSANKAKSFTYQGSSLLGGTVQVTTIQAASGGEDIEDIESIRFNAPKYFASQNRAVNSDDYSTLILSKYSNARSVNVWGGEDNDPPVYGKVFVCIKPVSASALTQIEKEAIKRDIINTRKVMSVIPEIVDPKNINVEVTSSVYYNPNLTTRSITDLKSVITQVIQDYNTNNLEKFGAGYRSSQLSRLIDVSDNSIVSNVTTIKLQYPVTPAFDTNAKYEITLGNPISDSGDQNILSSGFTILGSDDIVYIEDSAGILRLFKYSSNNNKIILNNIGTVNYTTGNITITALNITSVVEDLVLIIKPESYDVMSVRDQIVQIPDELITVNIIVDNVSLGNSEGGSNYTFTSSRS
jgi:hypothetical protein